MKKSDNKGYMLAETLIVTAFVAGILIYLYIQLSNLSNNYEKTHKYNNVPNLYALVDIVGYINADSKLKNFILNPSNVNNTFISINGCSTDHYTDVSSCLELIKAENISVLLVSFNYCKWTNFERLNDIEFQEFIDSITPSGTEEYRLIAKFNDGTYATLRFDIEG